MIMIQKMIIITCLLFNYRMTRHCGSTLLAMSAAPLRHPTMTQYKMMLHVLLIYYFRRAGVIVVERVGC